MIEISLFLIHASPAEPGGRGKEAVARITRLSIPQESDIDFYQLLHIALDGDSTVETNVETPTYNFGTRFVNSDHVQRLRDKMNPANMTIYSSVHILKKDNYDCDETDPRHIRTQGMRVELNWYCPVYYTLEHLPNRHIEVYENYTDTNPKYREPKIYPWWIQEITPDNDFRGKIWNVLFHHLRLALRGVSIYKASLIRGVRLEAVRIISSLIQNFHSLSRRTLDLSNVTRGKFLDSFHEALRVYHSQTN